jgi:pseudaminic acid cytidylyltransferase
MLLNQSEHFTMANVAVITARGGSKRIPRKNIKSFKGKPIIAYSIEAALSSSLFELVMVSTDDEEIAEIAKKYGADVPFYRSAATSDDYSGTADVMIEVLHELRNIGKKFEYASCIYPTAPFITTESLLNGYNLMKENQYNTVFPVCAYSHPVYRGLQLKEDKKIEMIWPENMNKRSQDLLTAYHDAGQFYWINIDDFLKEKKLYTTNSGAIILDELHVQDIDNETDWIIAELKYAILFPDCQ